MLIMQDIRYNSFNSQSLKEFLSINQSSIEAIIDKKYKFIIHLNMSGKRKIIHIERNDEESISVVIECEPKLCLDNICNISEIYQFNNAEVTDYKYRATEKYLTEEIHRMLKCESEIYCILFKHNKNNYVIKDNKIYEIECLDKLGTDIYSNSIREVIHSYNEYLIEYIFMRNENGNIKDYERTKNKLIEKLKDKLHESKSIDMLHYIESQKIEELKVLSKELSSALSLIDKC